MVRLKRHDKSKLWNTLNKVRPLANRVHAWSVSIPRNWCNEMGWQPKDEIILTLDILNNQVILRKNDEKISESITISD